VNNALSPSQEENLSGDNFPLGERTSFSAAAAAALGGLSVCGARADPNTCPAAKPLEEVLPPVLRKRGLEEERRR
jgi:hypothetical protein